MSKKPETKVERYVGHKIDAPIEYQKKIEIYVIPGYWKDLRHPDRGEKFKNPKSPSFHMFSVPAAQSREIFWDLVKKEMPESVLDVGCGVGTDAKKIIALGVKYFGLDPIPGNIKIAKEEFPKGEFKLGFAQEMPYPDKSFDWVLSRGTVECIPSREDRFLVVKECLRVAKKSVFIIDYGMCPEEAQDINRATSAQYVPQGNYKVEKTVLTGAGADGIERHVIHIRINKI